MPVEEPGTDSLSLPAILVRPDRLLAGRLLQPGDSDTLQPNRSSSPSAGLFDGLANAPGDFIFTCTLSPGTCVRISHCLIAISDQDLWAHTSD
jgi:hypothetical protein